jgi:hypothetical protein
MVNLSGLDHTAYNVFAGIFRSNEIGRKQQVGGPHMHHERLADVVGLMRDAKDDVTMHFNKWPADALVIPWG